MSNSNNKNSFAVFGLLFGALCWGIIWYPYRLMADAGIYFGKHWRGLLTQPKSIFWLSLAAGWTNMSYVLAVIDGEVMRVMLLFYLSPLWTLLLARFWLKEPITQIGFISIVIALIGVYVMLAGPLDGMVRHLPVPRNTAEWLALSSGMGFSLTNVITRKSSHLSLRAKSFGVWFGVIGVALVFSPFVEGEFPMPSFFSLYHWLVMGLIALLLMAATLLVQFGLTQLTAIRASVLFLFELVVAAIASYYLAHESMTLKEWIGGSLIVMAALIAALNHKE